MTKDPAKHVHYQSAIRGMACLLERMDCVPVERMAALDVAIWRMVTDTVGAAPAKLPEPRPALTP